MPSVKTHIMFQGNAEAAIALYQSIFATFDVTHIQHYPDGEDGSAGAFQLAYVDFADHALMIFYSPPTHDFTFTPALSLFVDLECEKDLDRIFAALSDGGEILMPLGNYGFSEKYGWLRDRFGLSWQLNFPGA